VNETRKQPEVDLSEIIQRVVENEDNERLRSFTSLINTFNYAIQVQAGRKEWLPKDFRLFAIALTAMDHIGQETLQDIEDMHKTHSSVAK
jgi:hypothetical protein